MPLDKDTKQSIMAEYGTKDGDTGSPEVQIAMMTKRIQDLSLIHISEPTRPY